MSSPRVEDRLRRFMLLLAIFMSAGTIVELWLLEHNAERLQYVPFVLCFVVCVSTLTVLAIPRRRVLITHRVLLGLVAAGGLFGIYEHGSHNLVFEREIRPTAAYGEVWFDAMRGASPLLAPGVLAVIAALAWAATYGHPALRKGRAARDRETAEVQSDRGTG